MVSVGKSAECAVNAGDDVLCDIVAPAWSVVRLIDPVAVVSLRQHYHYGADLRAGDQTIDRLDQPIGRPLVLIAARAVQHVQHRVALRGRLIVRREIRVVGHLAVEDSAVEGQLEKAALDSGLNRGCK